MMARDRSGADRGVPLPRWLRTLRDEYADRRVVAILLLGFSSGLPIMLVATTLSTWLAEAAVDKSTIGLFGFVFAPYTFKFAWAPLVDRLPIPPLTWLGQRRGWMLLAQLGLLVSIWGLGQTDPSGNLYWTALLAVCVAFWSATQDVVIDAYRVEILPAERLGTGAGVVVLGYRVGMWVATAGALLIAAQAGWSMAYTAMALLVLVGMVTVLLIGEPRRGPAAILDANGFATDSALARAAAAIRRTERTSLHGALLVLVLLLLAAEPVRAVYCLVGQPQSAGFGLGELLLGVASLAVLMLGIRAGVAVLRGEPRAMGQVKDWALCAMLLAIVQILVYAMLADPPFLANLYGALAASVIWLVADLAVRIVGAGGIALDSVLTPTWTMLLGFWISFLAAVWAYGVPYFSRTAVAAFGLSGVDERPVHAWTRRAVIEPFFDFFSRHGVATAVLVLALISLFKASDVVLTLMANPFYIEMGFDKAEIALVSKTIGPWVTVLGGLVGGTIVFRLGLYRSLILGVIVMAVSNLMFVILANAGHDLRWFVATILVENLSGGLGTAVFVAYLSSLCNLQYTAVQYALLTSFMQLFGKFVIVPSSGFFADAVGWHWFFIASTLFAVPALLLLWALQRRGFAERPADAPVATTLAEPAASPGR